MPLNTSTGQKYSKTTVDGRDLPMPADQSRDSKELRHRTLATEKLHVLVILIYHMREDLDSQFHVGFLSQQLYTLVPLPISSLAVEVNRSAQKVKCSNEHVKSRLVTAESFSSGYPAKQANLESGDTATQPR